jgi:hypothetical protein
VLSQLIYSNKPDLTNIRLSSEPVLSLTKERAERGLKMITETLEAFRIFFQRPAGELNAGTAGSKIYWSLVKP